MISFQNVLQRVDTRAQTPPRNSPSQRPQPDRAAQLRAALQRELDKMHAACAR